METNVDQYDVVKLLTSDQALCRNWKRFCRELGLGYQLYEFERRFNSYEPLEEIFTLIMEKWETNRENQEVVCIATLVDKLRKLGYVKCADSIQEFTQTKEHQVRQGQNILLNKRSWSEILEIVVEDQSTGNSYKTVFGPFLNESVKRVVLEDPFVQSSNHLNNFEHFLTLLLESCPSLERIELLTSFDDRRDKAASRKFQMETLAQFATKLRNKQDGRPINFVVTYDLNLTNRSLKLDNGWHFSLDKGLDYFYTYDKESEQWNELEIRKCKPTKILCMR